ncbi:MAG TPA: Zn-dependent hydrolase [Vicinamibacterales bacterium]|nr:Zn-dependent hydrolase [Vicinamibacterales bacterium]
MRMTRRSFLETSLLNVCAAPWTLSSGVRRQPAISVDSGALRARIEALSRFGRPADGTFESGVSRVAYSDADIAGRKYLMELMRAARLEPRIDAAGNILGRREGRDRSAPPIVFGSHIDSVPSGGNFDGDLGSLAALGAIEALDRAGHQTRHPLEVAVWSAEEGVAFGRGLAGSRIVAGDYKPADLAATWNGMTRADAIRRIGGAPDRIDTAIRQKGTHHCYLELHIEQGGTLEAHGTPVGVVEGIVSIQRHRAVITGFANHAGTTPMPDRQDALVAASRLTLAVRETVTSRHGRQVGTVGHLHVEPNAPNVIPGRVELTIELRDLSPELLATMADEIRARAEEIARTSRTSIEVTSLGGNPPALATADVQQAIERAAAGRRLESVRLPSGAGHDAQMMAQLGPMGMIFVPSIGGISHSPRELTSWQDCANGADVLLSAVLEMDRS